MNKHVQKIQKELEEAKEKLEKQQNKKVEEKPFVYAVHSVLNNMRLWMFPFFIWVNVVFVSLQKLR